MTSSSQYLEIEHCHAVCAELRAELGRVKTHYNDALRINAEQITTIELLKRQVNDQAHEIQRLKAQLAAKVGSA